MGASENIQNDPKFPHQPRKIATKYQTQKMQTMKDHLT